MDRSIAHPDIKTPVKTWWKDHYDQVFLALYPFYKIQSKPAQQPSGTHYDDLVAYQERPDDFDEIVKLRGELIRWSTIHDAVAPDVPRTDVYRAIWLLACMGYSERAGIELQRKIANYCETHRIYLPDDDFIPAILHPVIEQFFKPFEDRKIIAYDEFRENSLELRLSSFAAEARTPFIPNAATSSGLWAIHMPDPGILLTSSHDGTEMLVAMTTAALEQSDPNRFFETHEVNDDTYYDWLNPKDFFERNG